MTVPADFVHLHVHSHYSLEDGVASIPDLVRRARDLGMRSLALTDHNSIAGFVPFYRECQQEGIRPVFGCEFNVLPHDTNFSSAIQYRLVVLIENDTGYRNVVKLLNRAHDSVRKNAPVLSLSDFEGNTAGLIPLIGGHSSELFELVARRKSTKAMALCDMMEKIFGDGNIVFEIQSFNEPGHEDINRLIFSAASEMNVPCVATNDVHYLRPEDHICFEFMKGSTPPRQYDFAALRDSGKTRHLASAAEMRTRFKNAPMALVSTADVAERCKFLPNFERRRFPVHDFERGFDADSFLWDQTFRKAQSEFADMSPEIKKRLNDEFDHIKNERLSNNMLLLWEIAQFCRRNKMTVGVGHGRIISSLVAYLLGVTQINPLEYRLKFQPFEKHDQSHLDLRVEIASRYGAEVFEFLRETFGGEFVGIVGHFRPLSVASAARDLCKWFDIHFPVVEAEMSKSDYLANSSTRIESFFVGKTCVSLPHLNMVRFMLSRMIPCFDKLMVSENQFAISGENFNQLLPRISVEGETVLQADAETIKAYNIPRLTMEFNNLLNILDTASHWVRTQENSSFDPEKIPMDDEETYIKLSLGLTNGIEPFQSITMKSQLRSVRPKKFGMLIQIKSGDTSRSHSGDKASPDSAVPACLLAYRCAFIKAHYPNSFMAALLTHSLPMKRKFSIVLREARQMDIRIQPPNINLSEYDFALEPKAIRAGLCVVASLGERIYDHIKQVRRGGDFSDLYDFIRRTDARTVNSRVLVNLIHSGAFDSFGMNRAQMVKIVQEQADDVRRSVGPSLFDESTGVNDGNPPVPEVQEYSDKERAALEQEATGACLTQDPLTQFRDVLQNCRAISPYELSAKHVGKEVHIVGYIDNFDENSQLVDDPGHVLLDVEGRVATISSRAHRLHRAAIESPGAVLVTGEAHRRKEEIYLKATTVFSVRMVQRMSESVNSLIVDLTEEDARTLRLIRRLAANYRGGRTTIRFENLQTGFFGKLTQRATERMKIFFCPPFYHGLKKILPESRITIVDAEKLDDELLHALSPGRNFRVPIDHELSGFVEEGSDASEDSANAEERGA